MRFPVGNLVQIRYPLHSVLLVSEQFEAKERSELCLLAIERGGRCMQMYKCCMLANLRLVQAPGYHLRRSPVPASAFERRPRKQATRAQHARSASSSGSGADFLHGDTYGKQPGNSNVVKGSLDAPQLLQAQQYMELLMTQNAKMNLTGDLPALAMTFAASSA